MDDVKAIARVENTQLAAYGEREQVGEIVDRLMKLHPAAQDVGLHGMRAVAQLAILVGASPLPATNEIHVWHNPKTKQIQLQLGINYYRRMAETWGGVLWKTQPRPMTESERETYGVNQQHLAALCTAVKVDDMLRYREMDFKTNEIWDMASRTGIGVCGPADDKNGRPAVWTAFKRAEVDLYRQLFPTQMATIQNKKPDLDAIPAQRNGYVEAVSFKRDSDDPQESLEEFNATFFDAEYEEVEDTDSGVIYNIETGVTYDAQTGDEAVDQAAVEEAQATAAPDKQESLIADLRASIEATPNLTIGSVASALVATGLYDNEHHALQALKGYPDYPEGFRVVKNAKVKTEGAVKLFDWGTARKLEEE